MHARAHIRTHNRADFIHFSSRADPVALLHGVQERTNPVEGRKELECNALNLFAHGGIHV